MSHVRDLIRMTPRRDVDPLRCAADRGSAPVRGTGLTWIESRCGAAA
jgi:hypothetical protein